METFREEQEYGRRPTGPANVRDEIRALREEMRYGRRKQETVEETKKWKFPFKFKRKMNASVKKRDKVLIFYLNIKGDIETPLLVPIYGGNMVMIRNKPYEVDPRAFWRLGKYKVMIVKEIDRRPVSNLDLDEIRKRGDATDSDEFLIKAAMRAVQQTGQKPMNKAVIVIIVIAIIAAIAYFLLKK